MHRNVKGRKNTVGSIASEGLTVEVTLESKLVKCEELVVRNWKNIPGERNRRLFILLEVAAHMRLALTL